MLPSSVLDMKAFVPARDPELSNAFYTDLGFTSPDLLVIRSLKRQTASRRSVG